jgi:hypothetical protein
MQALSLLDCNIYKHATHFHKDKQKLDINETLGEQFPQK